MENKNEQSTASSLLRFAGPYKGRYILSIFLSVLGVASGLVPYYAAAQMLIGLIGTERDFSFYILWGIVAMVSYLAKSTFAILSTSVSHTATFLALRDIRKQIVDKLSRMPMGTLLNTPSGQLKDTLVDRVEGLETPLAHLLPEMSANVLVPIFIVIYLFVLDWRMALISLITIPVGMAFMATILKTYPQQYEGSVKINQRMNNAVVEYVNGIEVIKAFNQSAASYGKYSDAVRDNADYFYKMDEKLPMGNGGVQCHLSCRSDYRTSRRRFVLCCRKYYGRKSDYHYHPVPWHCRTTDCRIKFCR